MLPTSFSLEGAPSEPLTSLLLQVTEVDGWKGGDAAAQKVIEGAGEHHHPNQGGHQEVRSAGDLVWRIIEGFRLEGTIKIT